MKIFKYEGELYVFHGLGAVNCLLTSEKNGMYVHVYTGPGPALRNYS